MTYVLIKNKNTAELISDVKWSRMRYGWRHTEHTKIEEFEVFERFFRELGYHLKRCSKRGSNNVQHMKKCTFSNNPNFISFTDAMSFFNCPEVQKLESGLYKPHTYYDSFGSFKQCRFTQEQLLSAVRHKKHLFGIIEHQRTKNGITDFPEYKI